LFTVVTKTLTRFPRKGNLKWLFPFKSVYLVPGGVINAVGLTNLGIEWWCQTIGPKVEQSKISLVGSIFSMNFEDLIQMVTMLNEFNLKALELNISCPNSKDGMLETERIVGACQKIKEKSKLPLILKLSVSMADKLEIIPSLQGLVEAISINSVPWAQAFPKRRSPLSHLGDGAISGKIAQPYTWDFLKRLKKRTSIPIIGPSVWNFKDIEKLRELGAEAISFGSIFLQYPWRPTLFVRKDKRLNGIRT
jgi:dihydroorotate dehydrogenase (NAD+) catalytic subunit